MPALKRGADSIMWKAFKGLRNDVPAERFSDGDLVSGVNINIDETGAMSMREGQTAVYTGSGVHSLYAAGDFAVFVENGVMKRMEANYATATLRSGLASDPVSYCQPSDRVYFTNGKDTGVIDQGKAREWGLPIAPLPQVAATVGSMPAGDYQFAMTYLSEDGQEGGCGVAGRITLPAGSGISFTLPIPANSRIVAKAIYLTGPNDDTLRRALFAAAADTNTSYSEDTTGLGAKLETQFKGPAPAGQLCAYHAGRTLVAQGDTLYPSEALAFELFDLRNFISVDGQVTLAASIDGEGMYVGTDRAMGWLQGTGEPGQSTWIQKTDYGVVPGTLAWVDGSTFEDGSQGARMLPMWLSHKGVCVGMPGGVVRNLTRSTFLQTARGRGCAMFRPEANQYIAVTNF